MSLNEALLGRCEPFLKDIVASPGTGFHREVFADWLEEAGCHPEAAGQRWAAREGKKPDPVHGWYVHFGKADGNTLPRLFFDVPDGSADPLYYLPEKIKDCTPLHWEREFLRRCGEITWDENGNPVGRKGRDHSAPNPGGQPGRGLQPAAAENPQAAAPTAGAGRVPGA